MGVTDILFGWSWSSITVAMFLLLILYYLYPYLFPKIKGVPGPPAYPVVGSAIPYMKNGTGTEDLKNIKKYGKVFKFMEGSNETLVVADTDILRQILVKDFSDFTNRRVFFLRGLLKHGVFDANDDTWRRLRHLLTPSFTSGRLKQMIPMVDKCIQHLIRNIETYAKKSEKVELKTLMSGFTMDVIASSAFGLDLDSQKDPNNPFVVNAKKFLDLQLSPILLVVFLFPFMIPVLEKFGFYFGDKDTLEFYRQFLKRTIKERQQNPKEHRDFLQLMLDAENQELDDEGKEDLKGVKADARDIKKGFSPDEILAQALVFFMAGYDTTATTLSFLLHSLATNQDCQDKVHQEVVEVMKEYKEPTYEAISKMTYLEQCIQETLRIYPTLTRADRRCDHDTNINGLNIPAKVPINIPIYALHHDPEVWPQPEKFDPNRFSPEAKQKRNPFHHLPFGQGPRQCIGKRLALMEIKLAVVKVIQKFKFKDGEVPLEMDTALFTKSKSGVWVYPQFR